MTLPFTLGHENAGWVETMGPGATGFAPGDPVIVYGPWGCGLCMNCRQGMENYCQTPGKPSPGGLGGTDGGMAEYLLVPSTRYLIPLGDLDPREAAPLYRRRAHQLSRRKALGSSAGAGVHRRRHRGRRSRADGRPGAQCAQRGDDSCRGGYFGRQAEDRQGRWAQTRYSSPATTRSNASKTSRRVGAPNSFSIWLGSIRHSRWPLRCHGCSGTSPSSGSVTPPSR